MFPWAKSEKEVEMMTIQQIAPHGQPPWNCLLPPYSQELRFEIHLEMAILSHQYTLNTW